MDYRASGWYRHRYMHDSGCFRCPQESWTAHIPSSSRNQGASPGLHARVVCFSLGQATMVSPRRDLDAPPRCVHAWMYNTLLALEALRSPPGPKLRSDHGDHHHQTWVVLPMSRRLISDAPPTLHVGVARMCKMYRSLGVQMGSHHYFLGVAKDLLHSVDVVAVLEAVTYYQRMTPVSSTSWKPRYFLPISGQRELFDALQAYGQICDART